MMRNERAERIDRAQLLAILRAVLAEHVRKPIDMSIRTGYEIGLSIGKTEGLKTAIKLVEDFADWS